MSSPILNYLQALHSELAHENGGKVADYIPELASIDPDRFAITIATVDGVVYEVGDSRLPFTIQSISKALVFGLVLDDLGESAVRRRIGVEPSGEPFNAITLGAGGKPLNPMVNSGAITATSLVAPRDGDSALQRIVAVHSAYAGRPLKIDAATARSESETGHRNRAIAHLLSAADALDGDPVDVVERYFQQCSIELDCRDTAVMAATLAAGGINPLTGAQVCKPQTARRVLTVMATCGMYDGAGDWLYTVGLPAKSGVCGTIMAVLPGNLGIAIHSPRLDPKGNSVRGVKACRRLARELDLNLVGRQGREQPIHARTTLAEIRSRRLRSEEEGAELSKIGAAAQILELQGALSFATCELVVREALAEPASLQFVILDLRRVDYVQPVVARLLRELAHTLAEEGASLVLSGIDTHKRQLRGVGRQFKQLDRAMEWCEDQLLGAAGVLREPRPIALSDHTLLQGIPPRELEKIRGSMTLERHPAGSEIIKPGDPGDSIHLVMRGRLASLIRGADGELHRIATLVPGMLFGELAYLDRREHTGLIRADTAVTCYVMTRATLETLREIDPGAQLALMVNLARVLAGRASAMRAELSARERL